MTLSEKLAEHSFKTTKDGKRLFCADGWWLFKKPYIVPDEETEKKLYARETEIYRIWIYFFISFFVLPLVLILIGLVCLHFYLAPLLYEAIFYVWTALFGFTIGYSVHVHQSIDLTKLQRLEKRFPIKEHLSDLACDNSHRKILLKIAFFSLLLFFSTGNNDWFSQALYLSLGLYGTTVWVLGSRLIKSTI